MTSFNELNLHGEPIQNPQVEAEIPVNAENQVSNAESKSVSYPVQPAVVAANVDAKVPNVAVSQPVITQAKPDIHTIDLTTFEKEPFDSKSAHDWRNLHHALENSPAN